MSYTVARYALWILLCMPVLILGFALLSDLLGDLLEESRAKKARRQAQEADRKKRLAFEEEYRRRLDDRYQ